MKDRSQFQYLVDNYHPQGVACVLHFHIPQDVGVCLVLVIAGQLDVPYVSCTCEKSLSMSAVCMLHKQ